MKAVYIIGTADTKLPELTWLKECLSRQNVKSIIVDVSTGNVRDRSNIDVTAEMIAEQSADGPSSIFCNDRGLAVTRMSNALANYLMGRNDIAGVIGIGGSSGSTIVGTAMQTLPIGLPKILVSTMASGDIAPYIGVSDIAMLYTVTDLQGLNRVSRRILSNAAGMIAGSINQHEFTEAEAEGRKTLGITMFGVTTPCVTQLNQHLKNKYDTLVFHATGSGGRSMEKLAESELAGIIDITTTEICDLLFNGVLACTEDRMDVIATTNIPYIGCPGAIDMVNFGPVHSIPEKYADRQFAYHNASVTLMRTTPEENAEVGRWIGSKLNKCNGHTRFIIPTHGFSALDKVGEPFYRPDAMHAFCEALEDTLIPSAKRKIIYVDHHINDPEFAAIVAQNFEEIANLDSL